MKTIIILSHVGFDNSPYCNYVHWHARELVKQGYNVVVFAIIPWLPVISHFQKRKKVFMKRLKEEDKVQTVDGVKIIYLRAWSFSNILYNSSININGICYYHKIKKEFDRIYEKEDVVMIDAHTFKTEGYAAYRLKKKYPNVFTTVTLHGTSFVRNINNKNGKKMIKKIFQRVDMAICVSPKLKKMLSQLEVNNSKIIYNGINKYDIPKNEKERDVTIITVGNLIKQKNIDLVIKTFKEINEKTNQHKMIVIGKGYEENNLKSLVKELNLEKSIEFMGRIPNIEVYKLMQRSKIFILPSVNEGFGIVYIEAMLNGCITIGTKNEGIDGLIIDGENGFLVYPELDSIKKKVIYILENENQLNSVIENGKEKASMLTWENNAKKYIMLLNNYKEGIHG